MTEYKWSLEGATQALKKMYDEKSPIDVNTFKLEPNKIVAGKGTEIATFETKSGRKFKVEYQVEVSVHQANKNSIEEGPETIRIVSGNIISLTEI